MKFRSKAPGFILYAPKEDAPPNNVRLLWRPTPGGDIADSQTWGTVVGIVPYSAASVGTVSFSSGYGRGGRIMEYQMLDAFRQCPRTVTNLFAHMFYQALQAGLAVSHRSASDERPPSGIYMACRLDANGRRDAVKPHLAAALQQSPDHLGVQGPLCTAAPVVLENWQEQQFLEKAVFQEPSLKEMADRVVLLGFASAFLFRELPDLSAEIAKLP